ncbi:MAG: glycosyltransferase [Planctomycetota bacterium]|nr:glycosyltransferase [Planctomycetota bacterium]
MNSDSVNDMPAVSIILPTYNRLRFLNEAIEAIRSQTFTEWELIIVDDGSTDGTKEFLEGRLKEIHQPWTYIYQENQGPSAARNRGLEVAIGGFIAFYDSDDLWLPHHLADCVRVLEENLDIDWVYSATKIVDYESGKEISPNCFYVNGSPRPFLSRIYQRSEDLYVIPARDALKIALVDALYCGLQTSLIKSTFTSKHRLPPFAVGEDQVWSIQAAGKGLNFGCLSKVHVLYRQHSENISSSPGKSILKNISARLMMVSAFESLVTESRFSEPEIIALRKRLRDDLFWGVGYQYQALGMFADARQAYLRASKLFPLTWGQYKTFLFSLPRNLLSLRRTNLK